MYVYVLEQRFYTHKTLAQDNAHYRAVDYVSNLTVSVP